MGQSSGGGSAASGAGDILKSLFAFAGTVTDGMYRESTYTQNTKELSRSILQEDANAVDSLSRGSFAAGLIRRKASQAIQEQRLAFSASGVDASYGTPGDVGVATASNAEADVQQYLNNAAREAWGHKEVGRKYKLQRYAMQQSEDAAKVAEGMTLAGEGIDFISAVAKTAGGA